MEHTTEIQQSMISYSQYHIKDDLEGKTITVDEWIAKELERIEEKKEPRYCRDYEALIEVIEDISRIPSPMMDFIHSSNNKDENDSALLSLSSSSSSSSSSSPPIQYVLSSPHLSTSSILLSSPPSILIPLSLSPSLSSSTSSSSSPTHPTLYLLDHAFITLLEYCWDAHYSPHHPCPIHLLLDMEKMILSIFNHYNNNKNNKKIHHSFNNNNNLRQPNDDYHHIQIQLNHIIQIQSEIMMDENNHHLLNHQQQHTVIHSPWFSSSKMIQQWASSLSSVNEEIEWKSLFMMGINAYNAAKSRSTYYSSLGLPPPPPPLSSSSSSSSSSSISFSNSNSIYTIDHLEMLMQQISI